MPSLLLRAVPYLAVVLLGLLPVAAGQSKKEDKKEEKGPPKPGEIEIPDPGTRIEDRAVARQHLDRFKAEMKKASKDLDKQVELVVRLGRWDHPDVFKALSKFVKHKHTPLAVAAIVQCARQSTSAPKAGALLFRSIGKQEKRVEVVCAALVGMGRLGYDKANAFKAIAKIFRADTSETHKAAARYFGYVKAKAAFRMLAEKLEEPKNTSKPGETARPLSYWKRLWEEWKSNRPYIQWALSQIVPGETFETLDEARDWATTEGRKHGIAW